MGNQIKELPNRRYQAVAALLIAEAFVCFNIRTLQ
jgi:hypothetical protein